MEVIIAFFFYFNLLSSHFLKNFSFFGDDLSKLCSPKKIFFLELNFSLNLYQNNGFLYDLKYINFKSFSNPWILYVSIISSIGSKKIIKKVLCRWILPTCFKKRGLFCLINFKTAYFFEHKMLKMLKQNMRPETGIQNHKTIWIYIDVLSLTLCNYLFVVIKRTFLKPPSQSQCSNYM